ncbi:TonB-dependent receptor [Sulfurimonas sp. HSL-1716]|uniref:TonB-dependent receptor n=1 Tax=Hydrocurvibacter sulfurireducens TaxID=3131937 RepID=UPI0031F9349D
MKNVHKIALSLAVVSALNLAYAEDLSLDSISVTATKFERETKEVPQSVSVVNTEQIEDKNVLNVKDAISTIPGVIAADKSGGYDSRLIIRGAGLKANYGIREVMVMRDGVPMTDPDSFTRMDFVDIDDMQSVEVFKGPGSIYAANASGGVVFIKSKSVFNTDNNRIKLGYGSFKSVNANIKASFEIDKSNYMGVSISRRQSDNDWREWNKFDTTQVSLKYGHFFEDDSSLEMELSYTDANLQLPQTLKQTGFDYYKDNGKTNDGDDEGAWQKSGRYSKTYFLNLKYEKDFGDITFRPQAYLTKWSHYHPVTGIINDADGNYVTGADLAFDYKHNMFNRKANLVFGLTARADIQDNAKKYQYRDYTTGFGGRITKVLSDKEGTLASTEDALSKLYGFYAQETVSPVDKLLIDIGLRYDALSFSADGNEITKYDYSSGKYVAGVGTYSISENYNLFSPKIGITYGLTDTLNVYGLIASANQAPTDNEIKANRAYDPTLASLKASTSTNYEVGLKERSKDLSMDFSVYYNAVRDEIVAVKDIFNNTYYKNAGKTRRIGAELSLDYVVADGLHVGGTGSYFDYTYVDYVSSDGDFSGNKQRFIPDYQYSLFSGFTTGGFSGRVEGVTYGPYYMDDANTEKYNGYTLVTNMMLAYKYKQNKIQLNINNLFDQRYATEAEKVAGFTTTYYYTPASPRFAMLTYTYEF